MTTLISKRPNDIVSLLIGTYCRDKDSTHAVTIYYTLKSPCVVHLQHAEIYNLLLNMGYNPRDKEISHYVPNRDKCCNIL